MQFSFEALNSLTHATDYWMTCELNGLVTRLHKAGFSMYINGSIALQAFPKADDFNNWRKMPVVSIEGRERTLPQICLEFNDCVLSGWDLANYNLSLSKFNDVNLQGASLRQANLAGATFDRVNLQGADLSGAQFSRTNQFISCNLVGVNLKDTALPALIREAHTAQTKACYGNQCKLLNCQLMPNLVLSLERRPVKQLELTERLDQLEVMLREIDQYGLFAVLVQALAYEKAFGGTDAYSILLNAIQQSGADWAGLQAAEELIANITAELVLAKLQF